MLPTIDFKQIRPHDGAQDRAFEELCCQLAHLEAHPDGEFVRKGEGGDAGVECFWRLSSGKEYGWQAKYLFKLSDPEVSQLNKSFQEAFAKHASLCRYIVCLPFDLSDARAMRQGKRLKSQRDRWDELVSKWTAQTSDKRRSIEIIRWDASRISGLLTNDRPQYTGKVLYWFGAPSLARAVLRERVEVAIENLGPRYTPALHVDLPISQVLDGLCWDESFRERAREMRRTLHQATTRCQREAQEHQPVEEPLGRAVSGGRRLADALEVLAEIAPATRTVESLRGVTAAVSRDVESLHLGLAELQHRVDRGDEEPTDSSGVQDGRTLNNAQYAALQLGSSVEETERFLASHQVSASATRALLIRGEAGMGKSHLLADAVRERVKAGLPAVFVLGQHVQEGDVWNAVRKALDLPEQPAAYILGALDAAAEASQSRALVAIDAITEGGGVGAWRDQLAGFLREARALPRVAVVLTCRTAFERRCAPEHIQESDLIRIEHRGFAGHANEALQAYFDRQGLARPGAPSLSPEFHNPLFLKTVTKALKLAGLDALPRGLRGVKQIMDYYGQCLDEAVAREMGVPGRRKLGGRALRVIAKLLAELTHEWVLRARVIEELDVIADGRGRELLDLLVSEGALLDEVHYFDQNDDEGVDTVRFAYQRFSDHYIAERLLENYLDSGAPQESFAPGTPLGNRFRGESLWDNAGIAEAMAVQVPGVCRREFIALLAPEDYHLARLAVDFLASVVWRDPGDFTDETLGWLNRAPEFVHGHAIEDTLLRVATEPGHPYNADFLHKNLINHSMPDRDAFWSTYLAISYYEDGYNEDQLGPAHEIIDWSWCADKGKVETERLQLCSIALVWMFSTPHRKLRDRATKGLVSILVRQPALTTPLLERFATIDDPYIQERLYAAAYGAALNHRDCATVGDAADAAFRLIFAAGEPPPHLRLRDYARGIVELGAHLRVLSDEIDVAKVRPPYRSEWPLEIPTKEEVENRSGERDAIAHSVFRSDFNWYTMKSLDIWSATPIGEQGLRTNRSAYEAFLERLYKRDDPDELAAFRLVCPSPAEESSEAEPDDEARRQLEEMDLDELRELVEKIDRQAEKSKDRALAAFVKKLPPKEREIFETEVAPYLRESDFDRNRSTTMTFSYNDSARWIYMRAYALGWSKNLFEEFERNYCSQFSRNRPMLERMGKKYQYIALSELHARFSDHVKLLETPSSTDVVSYEGPWQLRERDIDPSLLIDRTQDPGWSNPPLPVWWCPYKVDFGDELSVEKLQDWLWSTEDIPDIQNLLTVGSNGKRCTVLNTLWTVRQRDKRRIDSGLPIREVQARIRSAIVRRSDVDNLRAHILGARRSRSRSPDGKADLRDDTLFSTDRDISAFFMGEWPWHASTSEFWRDWTPTAEEQHWWSCPVPMVIPVVEYLRESGVGDMSLAETFSVWIPSKWLMSGLKLRITNGRELTFSDDKGRMVFCDPSVSEAGPSAALIDTEALAELLEREGLALVWAVGGEKNVYEPMFYGRHCFSGLYHWDGADSEPTGELWRWEDRPEGGPTKLG